MSKPSDKCCEWYLFNHAFEYNPETGKLFWRYSSGNQIKAGDEAGYVCAYGCGTLFYLAVTVSGVEYYVHRVVWCIANGYLPDDIDHINGDGTDNRLVNLRSVSTTSNMQNKVKYRTNTSGYPGVAWCDSKQKYIARISVNGKRLSLGGFASMDKAVAARKAAEIAYGYHPNNGRER